MTHTPSRGATNLVTMDMNPVEGCRCHSCQTRRHSQDYGRAAIFYAIEAGYKAQEEDEFYKRARSAAKLAAHYAILDLEGDV